MTLAPIAMPQVLQPTLPLDDGCFHARMPCRFRASCRDPRIKSEGRLVPGIHAFRAAFETWMAGTSQDEPGHDDAHRFYTSEGA
jgi:hypothetical protein